MNRVVSTNPVRKVFLVFTVMLFFIILMSLFALILSVNAGEQGLLSPLSLAIIGVVMVSVSLFLASSAMRSLKTEFKPESDKNQWYESILDAIPFPISVTDMDMKWTFINRSVEEMLKIKRSDVIGKHCSEWGALICNTSNCGITCLKNNKKVTFFEQLGMNFKVDVNYLLDPNKQKLGHIEIVQDISETVKIQQKQSALIDNVHNVSETFDTVAKNIAESAQGLAQGSAEQAAAIEELSLSLNNVANNTRENAGMAGKASSLAEAIKTNAEEGEVQMNRMTQAVKEINDAGRSINQVIKTIDEIASQTNLLALNAAIEAARAGQHGRGFAVVAEEVRNLAVKSAEAAKDTGLLIVNSMEKAEMGMSIANETAEAFSEIVASIGQSNEIVNEIDKSLSGQAAAITEINQRVSRVAQIVQQNNAIAEESAAVSEEISSRADTLVHLLNEFKARSNS